MMTHNLVTEDPIVADQLATRPPGKLRKRRLDLGLSQALVAEQAPRKCRLTRDGLSRIESGQTWASPPQLSFLARFYQVERGAIAEEVMEVWFDAHPEEEC